MKVPRVLRSQPSKTNRSWQFLIKAGVVANLIVFAPWLPDILIRFLYTLSLMVRESILWLLPLALWAAISTFLRNVGPKAPLLLGAVLIFEALSNSLSVTYGYGVVRSLIEFLPGSIVSFNAPGVTAIEPLWVVSFAKPVFWNTNFGAFAGVLCGLWLAFVPQSVVLPVFEALRSWVEKVLLGGVRRLFPLLILGFLLPMRLHTNAAFAQWAQIGNFVFLFIAALVIYIGILYFVAAGGDIKRMRHFLGNMLSAGSVALTSCSSAATMPFTIQSTEKNLIYPEFARLIIPLTTHIQQVGDCVMNSFFCTVIYCGFHGHVPSLEQWIPFTLVFTAARYGTAATVGGAIFLMLPIYEAYLGFSKEMIALILAFNAVLDPIVTSSNVMANGALAIIFEKIWRHWHSVETEKDVIRESEATNCQVASVSAAPAVPSLTVETPPISCAGPSGVEN